MPKHPVITPDNETAQAAPTTTISRNDAARQQTIRNIGLIASREYKNRLMQRAFLVSTIIILVLLLIGSCVPTIIQYFASRSSSSSQTDITIINNAGNIGSLDDAALSTYISNSLNGSTTTTRDTAGQGHFVVHMLPTTTETTSMQTAVKNGQLTTLLILDRTNDASKTLAFTTYSRSDSTGDLSQIQNLARQLNVLDQSAHLGLTPSQTQSLFAQPAYKLINMEPNQDQRSVGDQVAGYILAYVGVILIFMSIFMYGVSVANGVAEEKGSRIMEILVNAATPLQLMAGKILGIGAAGLTQMALLVTTGIIGLLLQPLLKTLLGIPATATVSINITGTSIILLLVVLLYFVLGFLLYSTIFAAVGALVKRQEEVQSAIQPITWLFMVGYIVSFAGASTPSALWVRIISYVPFWTPTTMLMRIGAGNVAPWEIGITVVLMLIAIVICTFISARIYRSGILMYGQKPTFLQLIKLARTR
jgi:ABC-2 type transport system permease protein